MENDDKRILPPEEVNNRLKEIPGWTYANDKISKQFELGRFKDVIRLVDKLAPYFDKMDHHADMLITYKKIRFELQRFDVGGKVTERDFTVAKEIERLYGKIAG